MREINYLINLSELAAKYGDQETAAWFADGLDKYLAGADRLTLDQALGLTGRARHMKGLRDMYIRQVFRLIDQELKIMARCEKLAEEIRAFESRIFPNWSNLSSPPDGCSELRRLLFLAKKTGQVLPNCARTVYRTIYE